MNPVQVTLISPKRLSLTNPVSCPSFPVLDCSLHKRPCEWHYLDLFGHSESVRWDEGEWM